MPSPSARQGLRGDLAWDPPYSCDVRVLLWCWGTKSAAGLAFVLKSLNTARDAEGEETRLHPSEARMEK